MKVYTFRIGVLPEAAFTSPIRAYSGPQELSDGERFWEVSCTLRPEASMREVEGWAGMHRLIVAGALVGHLEAVASNSWMFHELPLAPMRSVMGDFAVAPMSDALAQGEEDGGWVVLV